MAVTDLTHNTLARFLSLEHTFMLETPKSGIFINDIISPNWYRLLFVLGAGHFFYAIYTLFMWHIRA